MGNQNSRRDNSRKGLSRKELARRADELLEKAGSEDLVLHKALARDLRVISTPMGNSTR